MKSSEVRELLKGCNFHVISVRKGIYTVKTGFFYRNSLSPDVMKQKVLSKIPSATILDAGEHWHAFVGGAKPGSAQDSYMWVKFTIPTI